MTDGTKIDVDPYEPIRLLATGATSQVWLARGPEGEVALKVARTTERRAELAREARLLEALRHAHLARLLAKADDGRWVALEYVRGMPMDQWCEGKPVAEVVRVTLELIGALQHLHKAGVIHGDVKPANVLVDGVGHPHLLDLSVATRIGAKTRKGFKGTLGYAAPERLGGRAPDVRTDVYGLGALLYRCLCGRTPFVAPDPAALAYLPLVSLPAPPGAWRPDLPRLLGQFVLALLARDPERRPRDLSRVSAVLGRVAATPPGPPVLGMHDVREELRRAVVGAQDTECRVVVVYGPPGSGRRTLIAEAIEAARREGLPYLKAAKPHTALEQVKASDKPPVVVFRSSQDGLADFARTVLQQSIPVLVMVHSERPIPEFSTRGAIQFTPPPLDQREATTLVRSLGADHGEAARWWRESLGLPIALIGRIRRWQREHGLQVPPRAETLPSESHKVLQALPTAGDLALEDLADRVGMSEHVLLDHCEVLFAEGWIEPSHEGRAVRRTAPQGTG